PPAANRPGSAPLQRLDKSAPRDACCVRGPNRRPGTDPHTTTPASPLGNDAAPAIHIPPETDPQNAARGHTSAPPSPGALRSLVATARRDARSLRPHLQPQCPQ